MTIDVWEYAETITWNFSHSIHGTTRFYSESEEPDPDPHGRTCSNCDTPLSRKARLALCRPCRNKCKSTVVQAQVQRLYARRAYLEAG